jgi:hypothetical protein
MKAKATQEGKAATLGEESVSILAILEESLASVASWIVGQEPLLWVAPQLSAKHLKQGYRMCTVTACSWMPLFP